MRRIWKTPALLVALLAVCSSSMAETMYVTDKLILGVYGNSDGSGEQLRIVRSGAKLEILERIGRYARILTEDGDEGWVKTQYLVSEPPAVLRVGELEARLEALNSMDEEDPEALRARNLELENQLSQQAEQLQTAQQAGKALQQELDLARDAVAVAEAQAAAAEQRAQKAEQEVKRQEPPPPPPPPPEPVVKQSVNPFDLTGGRINFVTQLSVLALALLLLGMFIGYKALDLYIRRQHGGFRIW